MAASYIIALHEKETCQCYTAAPVTAVICKKYGVSAAPKMTLAIDASKLKCRATIAVSRVESMRETPIGT